MTATSLTDRKSTVPNSKGTKVTSKLPDAIPYNSLSARLVCHFGPRPSVMVVA